MLKYEIFKNMLRRVRFKIEQQTGKAPKVKLQLKIPTERHGSVYGGWVIQKDSIDNNSIIYSAGIGEDISFDVSLIKKYNVPIYAFDPTPKVIKWLNAQVLPDEFHVFQYAISYIDGNLKFYQPANKGYVSHSLMGTGSNYIIVPAKSLITIMKELGHQCIDILKMDIEGAEYDVIHNILNERIEIKQILVEFHHFFDLISIRKTEEVIKSLNKNGYSIFYISPTGREYSFVKNRSESR